MINATVLNKEYRNGNKSQHTKSFYVVILLDFYLLFCCYYNYLVSDDTNMIYGLIRIIISIIVLFYIFMRLYGDIASGRLKQSVIFYIAVFLCACLISFFRNFSGLEKLLSSLSVILCCHLFSLHPLTKKETKTVMLLLIVTVLIILPISATQFEDAQLLGKLNQNTIATMIFTLFCIFWTRAFIIRHRINFMCFILSIVCLILELLFSSRTSFLGCLLFIVLTFLFFGSARKIEARSVSFVILLLAFIGLLIAYIYSTVLFEKYGGSDLVVFGKNIFSGRQIIWKNAFDSMNEYFWLGVGSNLNFEQISNGGPIWMTNAHNQPLGLISAFGIVPTILFYLLFSRSVSIIYKKSYTNNRFPLLFIVVVTIMSYFETYFFQYIHGALLWLRM